MLPVNEEALNEITDNGALLTGTTALIMLRAFSSGAVALTGVEAIADGVPAFRRPESRNAAITLTWMASILATAFFGLAVLTHRLQPTVSERGDAALDPGQSRVRGRLGHVLRAAVLDVRDPDPRRQHRVRRLPPALVDHLARRLSPEADGQSRRSPRVLERHRLPRRARRARSSSSSTATPPRSSRCTRSACSRASRCRSSACSASNARIAEPAGSTDRRSA